MVKTRNLIQVIVIIAFFCPLMVYGQDSQVSITKAEAEKVDIILLQDESGSMIDTDPHHIRKLVATYLIDDLEVAGEGNRMALILFGARPETRVGLSRDFGKIRLGSKEGFEKHTGPRDRRSPEGAPDSGYTDIYGALEAALQILSWEKMQKTQSDERFKNEKHVILLTDGDIDPWPGNGQRYGDIASEYFDCLANLDKTKFKLCDRRFKKRVADIDERSIFDRAGILSIYRKNGWRIHCVGFSQGVDSALLQRISAATYGQSGIAHDYTQLLSILKQIIPPAPNVVTLLLEDFCKTKRVEKTVHIDEDISAVQFKVDLNEMLGQRTSIRPDDLTIVLTDPHGDTISSRDGKFLFNTTSDGLVVTASYFQDAPSQGDWTILVEGGRDICGHLKVTARVPFIAVMELMPEMSTYYGDDVVSVKFGLKNQDNDLSVPMEDVTGHFRFSPAEAGGARIQEQSIDFTVSGDGNFAEADLRVPTGIKGSAAVETAIVDRRYRSTIKDFRSINVVPDRRQVMIDAEPEKVSLGIVGDDVYKVDSVPITLTTSTPTISFEVNCIKPRLMYGGVEIPIEWTKVTPSSGVMSIENPLTVQISVSLPENVPLTLPQGVYKGELEVEPKTVKMADGYGRIPVELQVTIPEIIAEPSKIGYDFKWRLGAPVVRQIKIGHTSADETN